MSLQYTFEIENFNNGQNLTVNIDSAVFPQFSHLPPATVGTTKITADQANELIIYRSFDNYSSLFTTQNGKTFPKAILRIINSGGGKNYIFTFSKAYLDFSYIYEKGGAQGNAEKIRFLFDKFSVKEESPVGNNAKRKKTSDRQFEAMMAYLKN